MATIQEFNYNVNILRSILWQYDQSPNLLSLVSQKQQWYIDFQSDFWSNWYRDVFNLQTANIFGLAVWAIILNIPLFVPYDPEPTDKPIWGFNDNTDYPTLENTYLNFENGNFSTRGDVVTLTLEQQRFLLRLRYYQLITRGEVFSINDFLNYLCSTSDIGFTGRMYALDGLDMTMTYVFTTTDFPDNLLDVLVKLDVLPRPAAVGIKEIIIDSGVTFGFNDNTDYPVLENTYVNFDNGNFFPGFFTFSTF